MLKEIINNKELKSLPKKISDNELKSISGGTIAIASDLRKNNGLIFSGFWNLDEARYFDTAMKYILETYPKAASNLKKISESTNSDIFELTADHFKTLYKVMDCFADPTLGGIYVAERLWNLKTPLSSNNSD